MIFTPENAEKIRDGVKYETRRILRDWHGAPCEDGISYACIWEKKAPSGRMRVRWTIGSTYSIQPGRKKKGIANRKLERIRVEQLQDITDDGIVAEGLIDIPQWARRDAFMATWNSLHRMRGERWDDNPTVAVLTFGREHDKPPTIGSIWVVTIQSLFHVAGDIIAGAFHDAQRAHACKAFFQRIAPGYRVYVEAFPVAAPSAPAMRWLDMSDDGEDLIAVQVAAEEIEAILQTGNLAVPDDTEKFEYRAALKRRIKDMMSTDTKEA